MRQILKEQRKRRDHDIDDDDTSGGGGGGSGGSGKTTTITSTSSVTQKNEQEDHHVQDLVGKLKRKCGPSQTDPIQQQQQLDGEKGEGKKKKPKR